MGQMITVGNATATFHAYLSEPSGPPKGGLVMLHEIWGLVDHAKEVADRFAAEGYLVVAPDLLSDVGITQEVAAELQQTLADPETRSKAQPRMRELTAPLRSPEFAERTTNTVQACFNHLEGVAGLAGRVAVTGFCFGGTYSFALAVKEPRLRAAVPFYGHSEYTEEELRGINCPVLAFYGERDAALVDQLPSLEAKMAAAGVDFEAVVYPGTGHAFFNDTNPRTYDQHAAVDAWRRTLDFLRRSLAD